MTLDEQRTFANSRVWQDKVSALAAKAALAVAAESAATDGHAERAALATKVLNDPKAWAYPFAVAAATNPALSSSPSDNDLEFTINSTWSAMAGAPGPD
jgi:hypothetical protein